MEALGSLFTPTSTAKMAYLPRAQGDGMDSEALKKVVVTAGTGVPDRYKSLTNSIKSTTIVKTPKPKFVPREPVKGAVKPVTTTPSSVRNAQESPVSHSKSNIGEKSPNQETTLPSSGKLRDVQSPQSHLIMTSSPPRSAVSPSTINTSGVTKSDKKKESVIQINVPVYNAPSHLHKDTYAMIKQKKLHTQGKGVPNNAGKEGTENTEDVKISMELHESSSANSLQIEQSFKSISMETMSDRTAEGSVDDAQSHEIEKLRKDKDHLQQQLEVQTKVNADLKKLLVASVGDDLHWKFDALIRDKAELGAQVVDHTRKISQDWENLDQLSIQADMWRSKYMASRVLIDKLNQVREEIQGQVYLSHTALQMMLREYNDIKQLITHTHRHMKKMLDAYDPRYLHKCKMTSGDMVDLATTTNKMAEHVKVRLLGGVTSAGSPSDLPLASLTPAELRAHQALVGNIQEKEMVQVPVNAPLSQTHAYMIDRFHPNTRYDGITFTCCKKCKGDIQVI